MKSPSAPSSNAIQPDGDSPEVTKRHAEAIRSNSVLMQIYAEHYQFFKDASSNVPPGPKLEIGSGGGFLAEWIPDVITSEVILLPDIELVLSAEKLPFSDSSLSAIYLLDVLHHLEEPTRFFEELDRCLCEGGRLCCVEPANTSWSRFVFQNFHHEPFLPNQKDWSLKHLPGTGRLTRANGAMPNTIFVRDREIFGRLFPRLRIQVLKTIMPISYLLSGGVSHHQLMPGFCYPLIRKIEKIFDRSCGMFMQITVEKQTPKY